MKKTGMNVFQYNKKANNKFKQSNQQIVKHQMGGVNVQSDAYATADEQPNRKSPLGNQLPPAEYVNL